MRFQSGFGTPDTARPVWEAIREEPQLLQSCSICLEPLWDAEPSVFVVNLRRLCPHYFCSRCAKRIVVEQTTMGLQNFKEDQRVGSVDGLASVLDAEGNRLGDLVWGESGQRLSDGELFLVLTQLERLVELEVGMELRGKDSDALVLRQGALFGCLLHAQRSLRRYTAQELDAEGLDGAMLVEGNLEPLRRRCVVYRGGDVVCWHCPRCSLENSSSDFRCKLCGAPPSCPRELPAPRPLGVHGVAALRTRFALRPQLHWAMPLQCPLCRLGGTAFVAHMPKLREAPAEWFSMVSKGQDQISLSELAAGLAVVLPLSPERLQQELQRFPAPMNYAAFVAEGGPAHWAAGQLAALTATGREPGICDAGPEEEALAASAWEAFREQYTGAAERGMYMDTPVAENDVKYRWRRLRDTFGVSSQEALGIIETDALPLVIDADYVEVLLAAVALQALLSLRRGNEVWRSNCAAELSLAGSLLQLQPASEEPLLPSAMAALEERKRLVEGQIAEYDEMHWLQRALYDTGSFQAHADWLKAWRQEWAEKLKAKAVKSVKAVKRGAPEGIEAPSLNLPAVERAKEVLDRGGNDWKEAGMDAVVEEVLHLMEAEADNAFVQERGCESLRYMAVDEESRLAVGQGISTVLKSMELNENSSEVQGYCCGTLVHLAATPSTRHSIIEQNGVEVILRAMSLHPGSAFVHFKACAALANLAATGFEQRQLGAKGSSAALVRSLRDHLHDLSVLQYCLGAVHNLASDRENQAALRTAGAVRALRDAVRLHPHVSEVQKVGKKTIKLLKAREHSETETDLQLGDWWLPSSALPGQKTFNAMVEGASREKALEIVQRHPGILAAGPEVKTNMLQADVASSAINVARGLGKMLR
ncbi:unnamed protein product [Effrenium voratum]|uniref:RanBP2-type domain-containing protein n=1 Tax=Effrenium voratum TaxID=2562239 RepID=A0AA36JIS0_9DINO|nr:unnamed protein product [Effrenium voratum]